MRKILLFAGVAGLTLATSCNTDLLNTAPTDRYLESTFWTTPEAARAGLTGCYSILRNDGIFGGKGSNNATALWEETASPNAYNYSNSMSYNVIASGLQNSSSGGVISARWADCYGGIGRCNTFLKKVDEVPNLSATEKNRMKGEAFFLRSFYYFLLQNYYGGVPIILDPPNKETQSDIPRATRQEVVVQIMKDLDSAEQRLPYKYAAVTDRGRATKGAAMALKAKLLLHEASPLFAGTPTAQKWKDAADAAKKLIDASGQTGYGLFANYRQLFMPANENNKEVIFDVQYIFPNQGSSFDLICRQYGTNQPLLGLAQAYLMKDGLPANQSPFYRTDSPYLNRDPRLYGTMTYPGDIYMGDTVTNTRFAITGFGMKKFSIYDSAQAPAGKESLVGGQSETNFIVLRYADILLMYAEAQNEFAGPSADVYDALDTIRGRVGMPKIARNKTQAELRSIIRHERRIELAGEGQYYNDIRRWKTAEVELNGDVYKYSGDRLETRKFNPARDYWWPIPLTERDLNPALEQNDLY
jgi:hypothetical protein